MARKDQKKLFLVACLNDDPFVKMLKENKVPFVFWAYIKAIQHWRNKMETSIKHGFKGDLQKQIQATINKAVIFFKSLSHEDITLQHYLSFLMGLANDLWWETKKKQEKYALEKIEENLFKLYQKIDPEVNADTEINKAVHDLEQLEKYF